MSVAYGRDDDVPYDDNPNAAVDMFKTLIQRKRDPTTVYMILVVGENASYVPITDVFPEYKGTQSSVPDIRALNSQLKALTGVLSSFAQKQHRIEESMRALSDELVRVRELITDEKVELSRQLEHHKSATKLFIEQNRSQLNTSVSHRLRNIERTVTTLQTSFTENTKSVLKPIVRDIESLTARMLYIEKAFSATTEQDA